MLNSLIPILLALSAFIVFAEGLNKVHRTDPLQRGLSRRDRLAVLLKVLAWICLVLGAGGVFVRPWIVVAAASAPTLGTFLASDRSSLLLVLCGFALLIVRSRFKEQISCEKTCSPSA